jgi:hypothetical protein
MVSHQASRTGAVVWVTSTEVLEGMTDKINPCEHLSDATHKYATPQALSHHNTRASYRL